MRYILIFVFILIFSVSGTSIAQRYKIDSTKVIKKRESILQSKSELTFFVEPYQAAFFMLIPKGWKTEGGMIPSGVEWNKLDLVESNIRFRVTSPDGKSFFGWYPRFYFSDPMNYVRSSGGILNPQVGSVMDGMWMYPYMTIPQFFQNIILGQLSAQEFQKPYLLGNMMQASELLSLVPQIATQRQAGSMNFQCSIMGIAMEGRLYTALYDLNGYVWSNIATFGLVAAKDRWIQDERIMEFCIRTFRLNPEWVARASQAEHIRGERMADLTREMNARDIQYQRERLERSSDSQTEFYKVLTDQMETRDKKTGEEKWLPAYQHAYTDGNGNYLLSDTQIETPGWKSLEVINRNAE